MSSNRQVAIWPLICMKLIGDFWIFDWLLAKEKFSEDLLPERSDTGSDARVSNLL